MTGRGGAIGPICRSSVGRCGPQGGTRRRAARAPFSRIGRGSRRKVVDRLIPGHLHLKNSLGAEPVTASTKPRKQITINNQLHGRLPDDGPSSAPQDRDRSRVGQRGETGRFGLRGAASTIRFLRDVARSPVRMGAVAPSSRHLARVIVDEAQVRRGDVVVELGGGSGSFTREILARHPDNPLTVFELSAELAAGLRRDFPRAQVVAAPVEDLPRLASSLGISRIDRVVSGLPWALWGEARQAAVFDALSPYLTPDARLVTFHYVHSRSMGRVTITRRLLLERFSRVTHSATVWANFPPAYVHLAQGPRARGS